MKTLDDFITKPEDRYLKLTLKGKKRLHSKCSSSNTKMDSDPCFGSNLRACESLCTPEDVDICRSHGITVCKKRYL